MPRIPNDEPGRIAMAQQILNTLMANGDFADSPIDKAAFAAMLTAFTGKRDSIMVKEAGLSVDYDEKEVLEDTLVSAIQRILDFYDSKTDGDPETLALLGVQTDSGFVGKVPPGQPRVLEIVRQTDSGVFLDWKSPADGGRVASYRIERRERPAGEWQTVWATNKSEAALAAQPKGIELEYRIIAFNSNGDSVPSNSVMAVL